MRQAIEALYYNYIHKGNKCVLFVLAVDRCECNDYIQLSTEKCTFLSIHELTLIIFICYKISHCMCYSNFELWWVMTKIVVSKFNLVTNINWAIVLMKWNYLWNRLSHDYFSFLVNSYLWNGFLLLVCTVNHTSMIKIKITKYLVSNIYYFTKNSQNDKNLKRAFDIWKHV